MKLVFTKLQIADTSKVKVSFANDSNGNPVFTEYSKAECESGIHFTEAECPDLSKIVIRGSFTKIDNIEVRKEYDVGDMEGDYVFIDNLQNVPGVLNSDTVYVNKSTKETLVPIARSPKPIYKSTYKGQEVYLCDGLAYADAACTERLIDDSISENTIVRYYLSRHYDNNYGTVPSVCYITDDSDTHDYDDGTASFTLMDNKVIKGKFYYFSDVGSDHLRMYLEDSQDVYILGNMLYTSPDCQNFIGYSGGIFYAHELGTVEEVSRQGTFGDHTPYDDSYIHFIRTCDKTDLVYNTYWEYYNHKQLQGIIIVKPSENDNLELSLEKSSPLNIICGDINHDITNRLFITYDGNLSLLNEKTLSKVLSKYKYKWDRVNYSGGLSYSVKEINEISLGLGSISSGKVVIYETWNTSYNTHIVEKISNTSANYLRLSILALDQDGYNVVGPITDTIYGEPGNHWAKVEED